MKTFLVILILILSPSLAFSMPSFPELSQEELARLTSRELVIHSREVPRCPWPEITVFAIIEVSPGEAAALFSQYQDHKNYIPDLIKSDPKRKLAENETVVDFEMQVPWPLANCKYSTGNVLSKLAENEYEINWYLIKSDSLVDSRGLARFIPYGKKTLLKYTSLIHPDSKLASMFSSRARAGMARAVQAIVAYVEETRSRSPEKTRSLMGLLPK